MGRGVRDSESSYSRAVRSSHEAALAPEHWPRALEAIADYVGGAGTMFVCHDYDQGENWQYVGGLREDLSRVYLARYSDNVFAREVMRRGPGLYAAHDLADLKAVMRTDMAADIWLPQGIRTILQMGHPSLTAGQSSGGFAVTLGDRHVDDLDRAQRRWRRISPQLRLAADLYLVHAERRRLADAKARLLDMLADAAFLVTPDARLLAANRAGEALAEAGVGLHVTAARKLVAADESDARRLRLAIAAAAGPSAEARAFRLFDPEGLLAIVSAVPEPLSTNRLIRAGQVLVRLIEPAADHKGRAATAARLFNLSQGETSVLALTARGRSAPQVAQALRLSPETVRTHLKHIYDKSGIRSQAELAQLVARLPNLASSPPK